MERTEIRKLINEMTLEEKAGFCSGKDFWHMRGVERLGIPEILVCDGPHGLRKQIKNADHLGLSDSKTAICFPSGSSLTSSFSRETARTMGREYGKLAHAEEVSAVLGPAINIKRSPLCGRNFEYYSEDPVLASGMGSEVVKGIQSSNVGACVKHFAANNQEYRRMTSNSIVDERTLREIYLAAFESVIKEAKPAYVMSAYNRVNGTYASENKKLLTDVLREDWGYEGAVMSDWGAVDLPVESVRAGLNVAMPGPYPDAVQKVIDAVQNGSLDEAILDQRVEELLYVRYQYLEHAETDGNYDFEAGHAAAKSIEEDSAVLLKNENQVLPLQSGEKVVLMGQFAKNPRYQGGGSSHIHPYRVVSAWDAMKDIEGISYVEGYSDEEGRADIEEAKAAAAAADKVVIFAGLTEVMESEAFDRQDLDMPAYQNELIAAVAGVQKNTIVVLHNGSPITMPWIDQVAAVLEMYLGGEAVGEACADLLYGTVNPSGRLAETFPLRVADTPAYPYYGKEKDDVIYREGILIGYRHYLTRKIPVLFPFGHGLSYTEFRYDALSVSKSEISDQEQITVSVDVTNTGDRAGAEVIQLYVAADHKNIVTPLRELKGFDKVYLEPGETKTVSFTLDRRAFAYWDVDVHNWLVPIGNYRIQIGRSSENIVLETEITVVTTQEKEMTFSRNSAMGDILRDPRAGKVMEEILSARMRARSKDRDKDNSSIMSREALAASMDSSPLRSMLNFNPTATAESMQALVDKINRK